MAQSRKDNGALIRCLRQRREGIMASYRYAASIIKRAEGRSVTAAAAYRAAEAIPDDRTGIIHDYSRKGGVVHAEIMAPDNTPSWMQNRTLLWNAVEAAERRKDSQLAREIQISLPYELTDAQRLDLVRAFVAKQYVQHGMIADFAIHRADKDKDNRNHHAHILLTMRALTDQGFGAKNRTSPAENVARLREEREVWARHQNLALERARAIDRVDHRSFKDREIDKIPQQHMGPNACKLEDSGKQSYRGNENRKIMEENTLRAEKARQALDNLPPLPRRPANDGRPRPMTPDFNKDRNPQTRAEQRWAERDHQRRMDLESRERHQLLDLDRKHQPAKLQAAADFDRRVSPFVATISEELKAIDRRLEARGINRFFRNLTGRTRADKESKALHQKTLEGVSRRKAEEMEALQNRQHAEKLRMIERYRTLRDRLDQAIKNRFAEKPERANDRLEADKPPRLPKHVPTMEPTPPGGARGKFTAPVRTLEEQVRDYARTEEGKKVAPKRIEPTKDWAASQNRSEKTPDQKPKDHRPDFNRSAEHGGSKRSDWYTSNEKINPPTRDPSRDWATSRESTPNKAAETRSGRESTKRDIDWATGKERKPGPERAQRGDAASHDKDRDKGGRGGRD